MDGYIMASTLRGERGKEEKGRKKKKGGIILFTSSSWL